MSGEHGGPSGEAAMEAELCGVVDLRCCSGLLHCVFVRKLKPSTDICLVFPLPTPVLSHVTLSLLDLAFRRRLSSF